MSDTHLNVKRLVKVVAIVHFLLILCVLGAAIFGIVYVAKEIRAGGLKGLVEKVWNGPDAKEPSRHERPER